MAFLGKEINVDEIAEQSFDPIPEGEYHLKITETELKDSASGGSYIKLKFIVIGPSHQGRVIFGNITIRNSNPKAEEIGTERLATLARAIGVKKVSDTDQLIGGELIGRVIIRPAEGKYDAQNEVKRFKALPGGPVAFAAPQPAQPMPASPAPAASAPPWARQ
jgi:hypothetical protein